MQFEPARQTSGLAAGVGAGVLLPVLARLPLGPSTPDEARALAGESAADWQVREARAGDERAQSAMDLAFTDTLRAERLVEAGSQAWERRETKLNLRERAAREQSAFRQALADAALQRGDANRSRAAVTRPQTSGAPPTDTPKATAPESAEHQSGSSQPQTTAPSAANDATATSPTPPATPKPTTLTAPAQLAAAAGPGMSTAPLSAAPAPVSATAAASAATGPSARAAATPAQPTPPALPAEKPAPRSRTQPATPAKSPATATGKNDANVERMLRFIRLQASNGNARATMRLDPPELGEIRVQITTHGNAVSLRVDTENHLAHRLLHEQIDALRQGLESAGVRLEQVEIRPPKSAEDATPEQFAQQQSMSDQDGRRDATDAQAERATASTRASRAAHAVTDDLAPAKDGSPLLGAATESLLNLVA